MGKLIWQTASLALSLIGLQFWAVVWYFQERFSGGGMGSAMTTTGAKWPKWHRGFEGAISPFDLGWVHGGEDHWDNREPIPRPNCVMTLEELQEYKDGYFANWEDGSDLS